MGKTALAVDLCKTITVGLIDISQLQGLDQGLTVITVEYFKANQSINQSINQSKNIIIHLISYLV